MNLKNPDNAKISKNKHEIITLDESFPLFGLDFIGILDRGTNLIEIKPYTLCNLRCKYCFVHSGDYINNFQIKPSHIIYWLKKGIERKNPKMGEIEIHIAPYGEIFAYPHYLELIKEIRRLPEVGVISIQTNGMLLDPKIINRLEDAGVTRLNISFNSMDESLATYLSGVKHYSVNRMLDNFRSVLKSKINLLIAPIWFFGINDEEIDKIIKLVLSYYDEGYNKQKVQLGIQNYLIYKTGRKLKKVKERDFKFFYSKLTELENRYKIKLKLGPYDFDIHPMEPLEPPIKENEIIKVKIKYPGRTSKEYIGVLYDFSEEWAVKILWNLPFPPKLDAIFSGKVIKRKTDENLITIAIS